MSNKLYISPAINSPNLKNSSPVNLEQVNARPQLNKSLMGRQRTKVFIPPEGLFKKWDKSPLTSRHWGDPPFFTNAKEASMLERGWVISEKAIPVDSQGLLIFNDGPEMKVTILDARKNANGKEYFVKNNATGEEFTLKGKERYQEWNFYTPVTAVPFAPRGGSRKTRSKKAKKNRTRSRRKA